MQFFSRLFIVTLFFFLPLLAVVPDSWAVGGGDGQQESVQAPDAEGMDPMAVEMDEEVADPLEGWNRVMFGFNDILYFGVVKPLAQIYAWITPEVVRIGVRNFFHNLEMPKHFLGALLQGDILGAGRELGRFGINTVLGLGLFDPAAKLFDMPSGEEDIGQALGSWGVGDDLYLVWPVVGPSNFRDTVGLVGDTALSPLTYYPKDGWARAGIVGFRHVNNTSLRIGEYEDLKEAAIDPYVALRDAYLKMRRKNIDE